MLPNTMYVYNGDINVEMSYKNTKLCYIMSNEYLGINILPIESQNKTYI